MIKHQACGMPIDKNEGKNASIICTIDFFSLLLLLYFGTTFRKQHHYVCLLGCHSLVPTASFYFITLFLRIKIFLHIFGRIRSTFVIILVWDIPIQMIICDRTSRCCHYIKFRDQIRLSFANIFRITFYLSLHVDYYRICVML